MQFYFIVSFIAFIISLTCFQGIDARVARLNKRHLNLAQKRSPGEGPPPAAPAPAPAPGIFQSLTNGGTSAGTAPLNTANILTTGAGTALGGTTGVATGPLGPTGPLVDITSGATAILVGLKGTQDGLTSFANFFGGGQQQQAG